MFTLIGIPVNRLEKFDFELLRSRVEIASAVGTGLRRELEQWHVGTDLQRKPVAIDAQVVVRNVRPNPAAPLECLSSTHSSERTG